VGGSENASRPLEHVVVACLKRSVVKVVVNRHRQQTFAAPNAARRNLDAVLSLAAVGMLVLGPGAAPAPARQAPARQAPARQAPASPKTAATGAHHNGNPVAVAAGEVNLKETGHLHAVGEPGTTIIEEGHATGTYDCAISVHLTIVSFNRVTATFTVKPKGGSVTGAGSARFIRQSSNGYFGGTIAITGGTGVFAHASGGNIGISGVISSETFTLTVNVHGKVHL
jgi:hypothetical protein